METPSSLQQLCSANFATKFREFFPKQPIEIMVIPIWLFPKIGVDFTPKMDGENNGSKPYEQMDDLGVPLFLETPISLGIRKWEWYGNSMGPAYHKGVPLWGSP